MMSKFREKIKQIEQNANPLTTEEMSCNSQEREKVKIITEFDEKFKNSSDFKTLASAEGFENLKSDLKLINRSPYKEEILKLQSVEDAIVKFLQIKRNNTIEFGDRSQRSFNNSTSSSLRQFKEARKNLLAAEQVLNILKEGNCEELLNKLRQEFDKALPIPQKKLLDE